MIAICTYPMHPRDRYRVISIWARLTVSAARIFCGIKYKVVGKNNIPKNPSIILSNHQSAWETLAFQIIFPPQVWVLKKELLKIPFFGWGLAMTNPIAIDRGSTFASLKQILRQGIEKLKDGWFIVMFPEGTRISPDEKRSYQIGGAWVAHKTGALVVPVAHNAGFLWKKNSFIKRPGKITVSIGEPINPNGLSPEQLNQKVENWISEEKIAIGSSLTNNS